VVEGGVGAGRSHFTATRRTEHGGESQAMAELAGRAASEDHPARRASASADAVSDGQPGRAQDAGDGLMAIRSRDHAVVHASFRVMAEHGGVGATNHQATGFRVSAH